MKKHVFKVFFITLLVALVCALSGCASDTRKTQSGKVENGHRMMYVFTAESTVMTIENESSVLHYMNALKTAGDLSFEGSDGQYGFFLESVFGVSSKVVSSTANSYSGWDWHLYTTITSIDGTPYSGEKSVKIDDITLYEASYGVSYLPCVEGQSYALIYEFSSMSW